MLGTNVAAPAVQLPVNDSDIAWKSDRTKKFGSQSAVNFNTDAAARGGATITGDTHVHNMISLTGVAVCT